MLPGLAFTTILVAPCTGPYCTPDTDFERPAVRAIGTAAAPALAVASDGAALLLWESRRDGEADIRFSRREPGPAGQWLDAPRRLDTDPPGSSRSIEPRLAAGPEGRVYAVWQDDRRGHDDILFSRSTDGGLGWSKEVHLGGTSPGSSSSSMAALAAGPDGRVFVAWEDTRDGERDIYLARSRDSGSTWEEERRIDSGDPGASASYHPQLVADPRGSLLVVWWDERDGLSDLYVRHSSDFGATWGPEVRLDPGEPGSRPSRDVRVSSAGARVVIAWQEGPDDPFAKLLARTSEDFGASWGEIREPGRGRHPFPVVTSDHAPWVAWLAAAQTGEVEKTSIGGRIREVPQPVRLQAARAGGPGEREVRVLSSLPGPAAIWLGAAPDRIWAARTGTLVGRAVIEVFENPGAERWSSALQLSYGLDLVATDVEITAHSLRGAVSPDGVVHLAWVADYDGVGDVGYFRLQPRDDPR